MLCFQLVFDHISSEDALQVMLTSQPNIPSLGQHSSIDFCWSFLGIVLQIMEKSLIQNTTTPGPTIIDKRPHTSAITSITRGA